MACLPLCLNDIFFGATSHKKTCLYGRFIFLFRVMSTTSVIVGANPHTAAGGRRRGVGEVKK